MGEPLLLAWMKMLYEAVIIDHVINGEEEITSAIETVFPLCSNTSILGKWVRTDGLADFEITYEDRKFYFKQDLRGDEIFNEFVTLQLELEDSWWIGRHKKLSIRLKRQNNCLCVSVKVAGKEWNPAGAGNNKFNRIISESRDRTESLMAEEALCCCNVHSSNGALLKHPVVLASEVGNAVFQTLPTNPSKDFAGKMT